MTVMAAETFEELPPEQRTYTFALHDATYAEVLDEFSRQSGLEIVGEPPEGRVTFDTCGERMGFELAFNRVCMVLFGHPRQLWLLRREGCLELRRTLERCHGLDIDGIFTTVAEFQAARLPNHEPAMVLYAPPEGDTVSGGEVAQYAPAYVRVMQFCDTRSITFFGVAGDVHRYIALAQMLGHNAGGTWGARRMKLENVKPGAVVTALRKEFGETRLFDAIQASSEESTGSPAATQPASPALLVWVNDPCPELIVRGPQERLEEVERMILALDRPSREPWTSRPDHVRRPAPKP
jgi:hypothetical protein